MRAKAFVPALFVGLLAACGGIEQLVARHVMAATLLATPDVHVGPEALGLDAGTVPDAGFVIPGQTAAFVFFGELTRDTLDSPPAGIADAELAIQPPAPAAQRVLQSLGQGAYSLTSAQDPQLRYQAGVEYQFRARAGTPIYTASVSDTPPVETIAELHPPLGFVVQPALQALVLTRPPPPAGTERPLGFATVFALDQAAGPGAVTYTNLPTQPLDLLRLVAQPSAWKQTQVELPPEAFPAGASSYLVVFQAAKLGQATSSNLSLLSAIMAGTADVGVVRTR